MIWRPRRVLGEKVRVQGHTDVAVMTAIDNWGKQMPDNREDSRRQTDRRSNMERRQNTSGSPPGGVERRRGNRRADERRIELDRRMSA